MSTPSEDTRTLKQLGLTVGILVGIMVALIIGANLISAAL